MIGGVYFIYQGGAQPGEAETKSAEVAAGFLGAQMEQ